MVEIAFASATSADYERCHKAAAATLEQCLNSHVAMSSREVCWQQARNANERCYTEVYQTYSPAENDPKRRARENAIREYSDERRAETNAAERAEKRFQVQTESKEMHGAVK